MSLIKGLTVGAFILFNIIAEMLVVSQDATLYPLLMIFLCSQQLHA